MDEQEKVILTEEPKKQKMSEWTGWKGWARDIVICIIIAGVILTFIKPTIVQEHSMENTLIENDYLFLSRQAYRLFGDVRRGDIIVFHTSLTRQNGREKLLIKRVIGLPGETVSIAGGVVYIDGEPLDEPYTKDGYTNTEMAPVTVPEGEFFCMGDNRQNSMDSRSASIGCVSENLILGKAVFRLFPFNKIGGLYKELPY